MAGRVVYQCNVLALSLLQSYGHTAWALRYAVVNALSSCKSVGLVKETRSTWNFQKGVMHDIVGPVDRGGDVAIHVPICHGRQYVHKHCNGNMV